MVARSASRKLFRGALKSLGKSFRMFRLRQGLYLIGPMYIPLTFAFQKVHRFNKKPPPSLPTILSRTLNTAILWFETKRDNTGTPFLMHNSLSPPSSYFVKPPSVTKEVLLFALLLHGHHRAYCTVYRIHHPLPIRTIFW